MNLERANIRAMTGYTAGEQPESADVIKLNTNENPFPPAPEIAEAMAGLDPDKLRRYPPPTAPALRNAVARRHGIEADNVIITNGGDELIRLAITTFVELHESIAVAEPSYSLYSVLASAHGCGYHRFKLQQDWSLPGDFPAALNRHGAKLCFVVNPHAPSGQLTPVDELRDLAAGFQGLLVLDEAYADFIDPALEYDSMPLCREFDNVLVLRTFSKGYSLAGVRIAYGIGARALIDPMQYKTRDSYNIDIIAQTLGRVALENQDYASSTWEYVRDQREVLSNELTRLGLFPAPSQSNFLLATVPLPWRARALYRGLKERGILVRYFPQSRLEDKLRITVGKAEDNSHLVRTLSALMQATS